MTERELIARLAEDQSVTVARAEDIVQAISDMITAALQKGDRVNLRIGQFDLRPIVRDNGGPVAAIRFRPSEALRKTLGMAKGEWRMAENRLLCKECKKRPVRMESICSTCHYRRSRKKGGL